MSATDPPAVQFRVAGHPVTQGSKRAILRGPRAGLIDANDARLRPWREAVRSSAAAAWGDHRAPLTGPLRVGLWFALPRPASAPKRRRTWPTGARSGDIDKLTRACLDSITDAGIWGDDSQVVHVEATKDWPTEAGQMSPGVVVRVWTVHDQTGATP